MLPRIIIFGASDTGKQAFRLLRHQYDVVAFADNDSGKCGKKLFDTLIISPYQMDAYDAELIVIASIYHVEIAKQLQGMGMKNVRIFHMAADKEECLLLCMNEGNPFGDCVRREMAGRQCPFIDKDSKKDNAKIRKKVLFIAYYFPPLGGSPIQRTLKFVKYLYEFGYEPIVLTTEPDEFLNKYIMDDSLLAEIPKDIQIIRIKDDFALIDVISKEKAQEVTEFLYSVSGSVRWMDKFLKAQKTQDSYILPDRLILWANYCARHIEEYVDMREVELVYSTVPEWSPHLLAYYFKQKYEIKWVADYRDPWVSNKDYVGLYYAWMTEEEIELDRELEKRLVMEMDSIIVAGGKWADDFVKYYGVNPEKITEITNGYDESDFISLEVKKKKNKKFTLCHNGFITYNRNPIPVIQVINSMIDQKELDRNEILWVFNGGVLEPYLTNLIQEDRYHIVVQSGALPHRESLQVGMDADVMVMYGECREKGYLNYPGKFYEYLRIGRPILCFSSGDSFQADVLRETGLGVNMDLYDYEGIRAFLREHLEIWRKGEERDVGIAEDIQRYERRNLAQAMVRQFDKLLG